VIYLPLGPLCRNRSHSPVELSDHAVEVITENKRFVWISRVELALVSLVSGYPLEQPEPVLQELPPGSQAIRMRHDDLAPLRLLEPMLQYRSLLIDPGQRRRSGSVVRCEVFRPLASVMVST
jgi:hypothetical protein